MKDYSRPFTWVVIVALALFTVCLTVFPEPSQSAEINFNQEVTGLLPDDNDGGRWESSAVPDSEARYNTLRAWGLARGKVTGEIPRADPGAPELLKKYQGIYLGNPQEKVIYLTFDEGYENGYTGKILDILYNNDVNAIFFVTGPYLEKEEELIKRMVDEGHAIGNHSINHKSLPMLSNEEIEAEVTGLDRRFYEKYGRNMVFLRPPKGEYSERSLAVTSRLGYVNVFWSFAYDDWTVKSQKGWQYAFDKVTKNLHNGAIVLLHAVSTDNAEALDAIIKEAKAQGYVFGDVFSLEQWARGEKR